MRKLKSLLKPICFLLLLALMIVGVQRLFKVKDYRIYQVEQGFYRENKDDLDAVYIGASNAYAFFQAPLAWERYGIAVYPLSIQLMPHQALKYMITETRKTQPDALLILNVNLFLDAGINATKIHYLADYMPLSLNKVRMINALSEEAGIGRGERLEFFFPIIRFHSGWDELTSLDFTYSFNGLKGATTTKLFLSSSQDVSEEIISVEEIGEVEEGLMTELVELLDYCDSEGVNVLFVTVPQSRGTKQEALLRFNAIEDYVRQRGYNCLDLMGGAEEMGVQLDTDYYNPRHMNLHGSMKFTEYLSRYLVENFGFTDKRGEKGYESWEEAASMYEDIIAPYSLPFEREHAPRDYGLSAPALSAKAGDEGIDVTWKEVEGADSYMVFRKSSLSADAAWREIGVVSDGSLSFHDPERAPASYTYTVVPLRSDGETLYYGNFSYSGTSVKLEEPAEAVETDYAAIEEES